MTLRAAAGTKAARAVLVRVLLLLVVPVDVAVDRLVGLEQLLGHRGLGLGVVARVRGPRAQAERGPRLRGRVQHGRGEPPRAQTKDLRELPGGYGMGSGTLARWIEEKMAADAAPDATSPWRNFMNISG